MIKKVIQLSIFFCLLSSCIFEKPFDNTLLNDDYWLIFQSSLSQVAFDNLAIGAYGYGRDSEKQKFIYFSEMWDTCNNKMLYFEHRREGQQIIESYVDTVHIQSDKYSYRFEWDASITGHISGCTKYNNSGTIIGIEKYTFKNIKTDSLSSFFTILDPCRIIEKQKFSGRGQLLETIEYIYFDDGSFEITSIKPE